MGSFFSLDNPVWTFLGKVWDVIWLMVLWFVCCIPIFTIGPSTAAFYYVGLKIVSDEEGYVTRQFFHSFRQNFKQGVAIGLLLLAAGCILGFNVWFYVKVNNQISTVLLVVIVFLIWLYLMLLQYVFAVLAKFENTVRNILKFSFILSIRKIGWTILMIAILIGVLAAGLLLFIPILFFAPAIIMISDCAILSRILKPLIEQSLAADEAKEAALTEVESEVTEQEETHE